MCKYIDSRGGTTYKDLELRRSAELVTVYNLGYL